MQTFHVSVDKPGSHILDLAYQKDQCWVQWSSSRDLVLLTWSPLIVRAIAFILVI